jgi:4-hydroxy-4-methyl-2-oxoglutarate aldolase
VSGPSIVRRVDRPPRALIDALGSFGVATLYEAYGRRGLLEPDLRPLMIGSRAFGPAITSLNEPGDNLMVHAAIEVCRPGDVLVVATTGPSRHGMVGELLATQALARGVAGIVIDAGVRDTAELRGMELPVWARAISAAGTEKAAPGWVNAPVTCAGVRVNPGDLVAADDDGIVVIAAAALPDVLVAATARTVREAELRERYARGELSLDVHGLRSVLATLDVREADEPEATGSDPKL